MLIDKLTKLNKSTRNAASASFIVIVAFASYNWFVSPHTTYLSAASSYESVIDNVIKNNIVIENKVRAREKELQKLQEKSEKLQNVLFTPNQAREFLSDLQAISEQTGCIVYSINLIDYKQQKTDQMPGIITRSALLNVSGLYKDIAELIVRLQARPQKVWIDTIKLRTVDYNSNRPRCEITVTICEITDKDNL